MRAADRERAQGAILGKAMGSLDQGTGLVLALLSLQYASGGGHALKRFFLPRAATATSSSSS
jgi:hypothetical protein